jgi:hypothetical protein
MVHLEDAPAKRQKHSVAELSRPNRAQKERTREERKIKQKKGCPRVHQARDAVYHNWFSPFLWRHILAAGGEVGWEMSASAIRNYLQKKDPAVFANISGTRSFWITTKMVRKGTVIGRERKPSATSRGWSPQSFGKWIDCQYQDEF